MLTAYLKHYGQDHRGPRQSRSNSPKTSLYLLSKLSTSIYTHISKLSIFSGACKWHYVTVVS